jgi:pimeloyl-ACP methyl ester carboxylesterase
VFIRDVHRDLAGCVGARRNGSTMTREVTIAERRLETRTVPAARASLPTLVFLHEGLGSLGLWRNFPDELCARTGCAGLVYSRWGNGYSEIIEQPRTVRYMHDEALVALPQLLALFAVDEPILIGHSDGASIALIYAGAQATLRGAILLAPHVFVEDISVQSIAAIRKTYESTSLRDRVAQHHADGDRTFYSWNDVWLAPEFRSWNIESDLQRIGAPLLLIAGSDDEYGTRAQLQAIQRSGPGRVERVELVGAGHSPQRDRPTETLASASAFIASLL